MFLYNNTHKNKKQEPNNNTLLGQLSANRSLSPEIIQDPFKYFKACNGAERQLLNAIILIVQQRGILIKISSKELAEHAGIHPSTVDKRLRLFRDLGIIMISYSDDGRRLIQLNSYFLEPDIKRQLSPIFKSLLTLSIFLLASLPIPTYTQQSQVANGLTPLRVYGNIYINNNIQHYTALGMKSDNRLKANLGYKIESLSLTAWGIRALSVFPVAAWEHADRVLKWATRVKKRFNFFFVCCLRWCKEHMISPDWKGSFLRYGSSMKIKDKPVELDQEAALRDAFRDYEQSYIEPRVVEKPKVSIRAQVQALAIPPKQTKKPATPFLGTRAYHDPKLADYQAQQRAKYAIQRRPLDFSDDDE